MVPKIVGEHNDVTQVEDKCGFVKIKTTMKHNEEPWMSPDFIGQVFYFEEPLKPTWSWVEDIEGKGRRVIGGWGGGGGGKRTLKMSQQLNKT